MVYFRLFCLQHGLYNQLIPFPVIPSPDWTRGTEHNRFPARADRLACTLLKTLEKDSPCCSRYFWISVPYYQLMRRDNLQCADNLTVGNLFPPG